jgi:hypothetical protein
MHNAFYIRRRRCSVNSGSPAPKARRALCTDRTAGVMSTGNALFLQVMQVMRRVRLSGCPRAHTAARRACYAHNVMHITLWAKRYGRACYAPCLDQRRSGRSTRDAAMARSLSRNLCLPPLPPPQPPFNLTLSLTRNFCLYLRQPAPPLKSRLSRCHSLCVTPSVNLYAWLNLSGQCSNLTPNSIGAHRECSAVPYVEGAKVHHSNAPWLRCTYGE